MTYDWKNGELAAGLQCYRNEDFFTAHEHWEKVWLVSEEPEKSLLQAVIQVAAACHHLQHGNLTGTISLLKSAEGRIREYPAECAGIPVTALREDVHGFLQRLEGEVVAGWRQSAYPSIVPRP